MPITIPPFSIAPSEAYVLNQAFPLDTNGAVLLARREQDGKVLSIFRECNGSLFGLVSDHGRMQKVSVKRIPPLLCSAHVPNAIQTLENCIFRWDGTALEVDLYLAGGGAAQSANGGSSRIAALDFLGRGDSNLRQKKYDRALNDLITALQYFKKGHGSELHPDFIECYNLIGMVYKGKQQPDNAAAAFAKAQTISERLCGIPGKPAPNGHQLKQMGDSSFQQEQYDDAHSYLFRALESFKKTYGSEKHPDVIECLKSIGRVYYAKQQFKEAANSYTHAQKIFKALNGGREDPTIAGLISDVASAQEASAAVWSALRSMGPVPSDVRVIIGEIRPAD